MLGRSSNVEARGCRWEGGPGLPSMKARAELEKEVNTNTIGCQYRKVQKTRDALQLFEWSEMGDSRRLRFLPVPAASLTQRWKWEKFRRSVEMVLTAGVG